MQAFPLHLAGDVRQNAARPLPCRLKATLHKPHAKNRRRFARLSVAIASGLGV